MQNESPIRVYRPPLQYRLVRAVGRWRVERHLGKDFTELQIHRPIDHQPHGAVVVVFAEVSYGLVKVRVPHTRHRNEEVIRQEV